LHSKTACEKYNPTKNTYNHQDPTKILDPFFPKPSITSSPKINQETFQDSINNNQASASHWS